MIPVNNFSGIIRQESASKDNHIIILLLVKPSDNESQEVISKFNYLHKKSGSFCNIYPIGYSENFTDEYNDIMVIKGTENRVWKYSDQCFLEFISDISKRLPSWKYVEDIQLVILQNKITGSTSLLDFRNYVSIDVNYGVKKMYIESFARFIGAVIEASKVEVDAKSAIKRANHGRYTVRQIIESAISSIPRLPNPVKHIINDRLFYLPSNRSR